MIKSIFKLIIPLSVIFSGCQDLDLNPLTEGSSENWFSNEGEFQMAVNELYRETYWYWEATRFGNTDRFGRLQPARLPVRLAAGQFHL